MTGKNQTPEVELSLEIGRLTDQYQMQLDKSSFDVWGFERTIQNGTTGVRFQWAPREEKGWHVLIARLRGGEFPKHPITIRPDTVLDRFDLRDLGVLRINSTDGALRRKLTDDQPLTASECIDLILQCCGDVLLGDFAIFSDLDHIVRGRSIQR